jgi:hypothetical protein
MDVYSKYMVKEELVALEIERFSSCQKVLELNQE